MKIPLAIISLSLIMGSCATSFYQLYNVEPLFESVDQNGGYIFEDENCRISYALWSEGGNIGFNFHNKTDQNIDINLNKSFFIYNGFANDYYKNRTYTRSKTSSVMATNRPVITSSEATTTATSTGTKTTTLFSTRTTGLSSTVGNAVTEKEDSIVTVPARTTKRVSEYPINYALIRSCDMLKYPMTKDIKTMKYDKTSSPLVFSNRIYYSIAGNGKEVENEFYVSEITNYPSSEFFEYKNLENCGQKSTSKPKHFKYYDQNKFYIKYQKTGGDTWKN